MHKRLRTAGILVGCALLQEAALAVESSATDAAEAPAAGADTLEEITVTAQKRETSAQNTPISLAVYSGQDLEQRGVTDFAALASVDNSLNLSYSSGEPVIAIRGVSSENVTEIGDPAVSIANDGIFNNRPYGVFGGLYDISRVEILRGPQGTLFGRNSTGGSVDIISQRPTKTDEGSITGEVGNYNLVGFTGYGNMAVSDELQLRLSFISRSHSGYSNNTPATDRGNDEDLHSGRIQLAYEPTAALKVWLLGQITHAGGTGVVFNSIPFTFLDGVGGEPVHQVPSNVGDGLGFPIYGRYSQDMTSTDVRGNIVYTLPSGISFTYLGGYNDIRYAINQPLNPYYFGTPETPIVPAAFPDSERPTTLNQEVRVASAGDSRLTWQGGFYFFQENSSVFAHSLINPGSSIEQEGVAFIEPKVNSYSRAAFATIGYAFTDQFKLTGGARYTRDSREREATFVLDPVLTGAPDPIELPFSGTSKSSKTTWSVDADYQVTPENLLYAKVGTGYKAGGFNDAESQYGPETVLAYEAGSKNRFLNNHLEFNADIFLMNYKNQQVSEFVAGTESTGSITVNAGRSTIYGFESNLAYRDELLGRVQFSANYTRARYSEFEAAAGWDSTVNLDMRGNTPPLSPTASVSGQYEKPVEIGGGATLTPRVSFKYQSAVFFSANNYPDERQGGYGLIDLGLDFVPAKGNWLISAYMKNVGNKTAFADAEEFYTYNNYNFAFISPRTYGLRVTDKF